MRVLDLFSGIGGFSLGLERAGLETAAFCEIMDFNRRVLAKHWPEVPCYEDVTKLTGDILERDGITVDVITGGFPCQDLSASGTGEGLDGKRSGLWFEILRLISDLQPKYVILENSPNLIGGQNGRWARTVFGGLAEVGYDAEWDVIPAAYAGAPHRRERVWIIAYPHGVRQPGQGQLIDAIHPAPGAFREADRLVDAFSKNALPFMCRGHDGVPNGLEQLTGYGNAVVPQIPEIIGRAIMADSLTQ